MLEHLNSDRILFHIVAIVIALFGGFTKFLIDDNHNWYTFTLAIVAAGFSGWLCSLICKEFNISENLTYVICGLGGLSGETTIKMLKKSFEKKLKDRIDS